MPNIVTILIVDDHAVVREGISTILERQGHFKIIGEAQDGEEAIEKARALRPDVVIMDIRMPGMSGIEACAEIINSVKDCRVIMLTAYKEEELLFAAIQAGASGYVLKMTAANEIAHAVERVSCGEGFLDCTLIGSVFRELHQISDTHQSSYFSALTVTERSVLALLTKGMTNRQIAGKLFLGEGTIRNYVTSVLTKLAVANRAEAAAFAVKHRLADLVPANTALEETAGV